MDRWMEDGRWKINDRWRFCWRTAQKHKIAPLACRNLKKKNNGLLKQHVSQQLA